MKKCLSNSNCSACIKRANCEDYQLLKDQLKEGESNWELKVKYPWL